MFGHRSCPACTAKEAHILSLVAEIEMLRKLVLPAPVSPRAELVRGEANQILNNIDTPISYKDAVTAEQRAIHNEAKRLLTGNY